MQFNSNLKIIQDCCSYPRECGDPFPDTNGQTHRSAPTEKLYSESQAPGLGLYNYQTPSESPPDRRRRNHCGIIVYYFPIFFI